MSDLLLRVTICISFPVCTGLKPGEASYESHVCCCLRCRDLMGALGALRKLSSCLHRMPPSLWPCMLAGPQQQTETACHASVRTLLRSLGNAAQAAATPGQRSTKAVDRPADNCSGGSSRSTHSSAALGRRTVAVGMSGGVDSAVSAMLLKQQG